MLRVSALQLNPKDYDSWHSAIEDMLELLRRGGERRWCVVLGCVNGAASEVRLQIRKSSQAISRCARKVNANTIKSGKDKPVKKLISTKLIVRSRCEGAMQENRVQDPEDQ